MRWKSSLTNLALIAVYTAVGVGLTAVWRMHRNSGATVASDSDPGAEVAGMTAAADPVAPSLAQSTAGEPAATLRALSPTSSSAATQSNEALPGGGRKLILPETPPSADPRVAERQRRIALGDGASLQGMRPLPADSPWNTDISASPIDPLSEALVRSIGWDRSLHPCFGRGEPDGKRDGIPYVVVSSAQPRAPIEFVEYPDDSDPGPYPIPTRAPVEGDPGDEGDRHVVVIDRDEWKLYELYRAFEVGGGWKADSGAVWDLKTNQGRPLGLTSADAAGLPIFPGLVRYDEVAAGEIRHALRFTVSTTRRAYVPPASHWASRESSPLLPPMGMRVRLKRSVDISGYPREVQVILKCLQTYGMILADNGGDWFITGAPDSRWDDDALHTLKQIRGQDLEVIRMEGLVAE